MEIHMKPSQAQALSAQQIQSMEILQMGYQELLDYIGEALVENPVLDADALPMEGGREGELIQKLRWLEAEDRQNRHYIRTDWEDGGDIWNTVAAPAQEELLYQHVLQQLEAAVLAPPLLRAARFAAANLDENGYLKGTAAELAESLGVSQALMAAAIAVLREMEPPGIGARDLTDCLRLQLRRLEDEPLAHLAEKMVEVCLAQLSRSQYGRMSKMLGRPEAEVRRAAELVRELNPRPGADFSTGGQVEYIRPDIVVVRFQDHFELLTGDYDLPGLRISKAYTRMLEEGGDPEVVGYLQEKMRHAKWLMGAVAQRRSTLIRCAEGILQAQELFFRGEVQTPRPMTMAELAEAVGLHESTVSRAIRGKYLQCLQGIYPLAYFFSRRLGEEDVSTDDARKILRQLIDGEDKTQPLSDQKLTEQMEKQGVVISRRTVAKYRGQMHIPSAGDRKIIE